MGKRQRQEEPEEEEVKSHLGRNLCIGLLVAVVIFFICSVTIKHPLPVVEVRMVEEAYTVTEQVEEAYQTTEWVDEVYTTTECVEKQLGSKIETYSQDGFCVSQNSVCDSYEQYCCETNWYGGCSRYCSRCAGYSYPCTNYKNTCSVKLKNLDNEQGGMFVFSNTFKDRNGNSVKTETKSVYISRADTSTLNFDYYTSTSSWINCQGSVIAPIPTKEVCDEVVRTRSVPKTVTKTRFVDKQVVKTKFVEKDFQVTKYYTWMEQWTGQVRWRYKV